MGYDLKGSACQIVRELEIQIGDPKKSPSCMWAQIKFAEFKATQVRGYDLQGRSYKIVSVRSKKMMSLKQSNWGRGYDLKGSACQIVCAKLKPKKLVSSKTSQMWDTIWWELLAKSYVGHFLGHWIRFDGGCLANRMLSLGWVPGTKWKGGWTLYHGPV